MSLTNIMAIRRKAIEVRTVSQMRRLENDMRALSSVSMQTRMKKMVHKMIETIGATNQLDMITPSLVQLMLLEPTVARPVPIRAPTTV